MTAQTIEEPAAKRRLGDRVFRGICTTAGVIILLMLGGVAVFLTAKSIPALTASPDKIAEAVTGATSFADYVWPLLFGTVLAAALALIIAMPLAIGVALFISHYAPRRIAWGLGYVIDLLAAVPSVVYGLWGICYSRPRAAPVRLAGHAPRLDPALRRPAVRDRTHHPHGGDRARDHDPADHAPRQPRGLPADARGCTRRPRSLSAPRAGR